MTTNPVLAAARLANDTRTEKQVELACDRLMAMLGFEILRFSQPRASMQTPGISDRRYIHRAKKVSVWMEVKTARGVQSPAQRWFEEVVTSIGEHYVCGTDDALLRWLAAKGIIRPLTNGMERVG